MKRQGFVIITTQRSGSSWLVDLIDSHPATRVYSEIFLDAPMELRPWNVGLLPPMRFAGYSKTTRAPRPFSTFSYLDSIAALDEQAAVFGFKLMYNHWLRHPEIALRLVAHGYKVVHLVRGNSFDAYLSGLRVRETGVPHAVDAEVSAPLRLHVDVEECIRYIRGRNRAVERVRRVLKLLRLQVVEIEYEALRDDLDRELRKITELLGLPEHAWQSRFHKIVSGGYDELVNNYDELRQAFATHGYQGYLGEPPAP